MTDDMEAIFREELRDLLESLEGGLLNLSANSEDAEAINQVFRDLHTIKGSGAMFGFGDLAAFVHNFESLFEKVRDGSVKATQDIVRLAFEARDEIQGLVDGTPDPDGHRDAILERAKHALAGGNPAPTAPMDAVAHSSHKEREAELAETADASAKRFAFRLSGPAFDLGARPEIILDELRALGATDITAQVDHLPSLEDLTPSDCHIGWKMILPAGVTESQIEEVFMFSEADWTLEVSESPVAASTPAADASSEIATEAPKDAAPTVPSKSEPSAPRAQTAPSTTVRVPADRLDAMMDTVGELVIAEARLTELARASKDAALIATSELITRLASSLRETTMTMRMVPVRSLMPRFRRLVMDLSASLNKPVNFVTSGEDTELDKTVIDKLADPLVHILRNAMDHGMDPAAARKAVGKPEVGTVELTARQVGAEVIISVRDDGRGIDADVIRDKAVSQGLIVPDAQLNRGQILRLIFEPGFSTAAQVTELSGRGVGMDVVQRTIASLRGQLDVSSELGQGTTVTLRLPLTLAIVEGLLIEVQGERFTLPMNSVTEIVELPSAKRLENGNSDFLDIRGQYVPFVRLRKLFNFRGEAPKDQIVVIAVLGDARVGLVVDRIVGTTQAVIKQMTKLHADVRSIAGATILGDGSIALILDVAHLVTLGQRIRQTAKQPEVAA